jgi:hypothetical protein
MAIFYLLHNIYPLIKDTIETYGQRNTLIFIFGVFIYIVLWIKHLEIKKYIEEPYYDTLKFGFLIIIFMDIAVMGWLYKGYFGRNIVSELNLCNDENYEYDQKNQRYHKKSFNKSSKEQSEKQLNKSSNKSSIKSSNKQLEDKQLEDKQLEDKQLEDKQLEDKQLEDKQLEDKQLEDKQSEYKQSEYKQSEDKQLNKNKTLFDSIKELKNNIFNNIIPTQPIENNKSDNSNTSNDDKNELISEIMMNKEIETLNDLTSKMV